VTAAAVDPTRPLPDDTKRSIVSTHDHAEHHAPIEAVPFQTPGLVRTAAIGLAVVGAALFAFGLISDSWRGWANGLVASWYFLSLAVGATFVLAIMHVTKAGWGVVVRRIPEAMGSYLIVGLVTMLAVCGLGMHDLYEWSHPDIVAKDALLMRKAPLLNAGWLFGSIVLGIGGWALFQRAIRKHSVAQDTDGDEAHTGKSMVLSVLFIIFFGLSLTMGSVIWLMSLEPHWFSTMFGVYQFSGAHKAAAAAITLLILFARKNSKLGDYANENHLHDMGKMMFAFATFWAYIWVSQWMLIWYANIPEETGYYISRTEGGWGILFVLNVLMNWLIPFFVLLPRANKRNPKILTSMAILLLLGHWLDIYLQVLPGVSHFAAHHTGQDIHGPFFGPAEIGAMAMLGGVFLFVVTTAMQKASLLPTKDPYLSESIGHWQ
jgi:hypothetical protein